MAAYDVPGRADDLKADRCDCPLRHRENGNCSPTGGFCTAVVDEVCAALRSAYNKGFIDGATEAKNLCCGLRKE